MRFLLLFLLQVQFKFTCICHFKFTCISPLPLGLWQGDPVIFSMLKEDVGHPSVRHRKIKRHQLRRRIEYGGLPTRRRFFIRLRGSTLVGEGSWMPQFLPPGVPENMPLKERGVPVPLPLALPSSLDIPKGGWSPMGLSWMEWDLWQQLKYFVISTQRNVPQINQELIYQALINPTNWCTKGLADSE